MSSPYQCPCVVKGVPIDTAYFRENFSGSADPLKLLPTRYDLAFSRTKKGFHGGPGGVFSVFPDPNEKPMKKDDVSFVGVAVHAADGEPNFGGILPCQLTNLATIVNRSLASFEIGSAVFARPPAQADPLSSRHRQTAVLTTDANDILIGRAITKGLPDASFEVLLHGGS